MHRLVSLCLTVSLVAILLSGPALAEPPAKNTQAAVAPPAKAPDQDAPPAAEPPTTDPAALKKLIMERLKKEWAVNPPATQPAAPPVKPAAAQGPKTARDLKASLAPFRQQRQKPGAKPPAKKKGCGSAAGTQVDLTPRPPTEPQPRWACDEPVVELEPVWAGSSAVFVFNFRNDGEGVLNLRLKGG